MKKIVFALCCLGTLGACKDAVPDVDPKAIVVDGKPMTGLEFMKTYCGGKPENATCQKVSRETIASSSKGKMVPSGW